VVVPQGFGGAWDWSSSQAAPFDWQPGDLINTPTRNGTYPGPNTVRSRYWINRSVYAEPGEFSSSDLQHMFGGRLVSKARTPIDPFSGTPLELEHVIPQRTTSASTDDRP
jgi:hypothetical protein